MSSPVNCCWPRQHSDSAEFAFILIKVSLLCESECDTHRVANITEEKPRVTSYKLDGLEIGVRFN
jgi:hypothetical protein